MRAGFTPACVYETDTASCVHLVQVGRAVGLCRATFPVTPGVLARPLAGSPLMWRHLLGRHPAAPAATRAAVVLEHARTAHADALARSASAVATAPPVAGAAGQPSGAAFSITTGTSGTSPCPPARPVRTAAIESTTSWPSVTTPKTA